MTEFVSWYNQKTRSDGNTFLDFKDLVSLNLIAPSYHCAFGYDLDELSWAEEGNKFEKNIRTAIPKLVKTTDYEFYYLDLKVAEKTANKTWFPHKTIVIRLSSQGDESWTTKPPKVSETEFSGDQKIKKADYWYNLSLKPNKKLIGNTVFLAPLKSRTFIHVIDKFTEIEISSEEKDAPITIDDILFATRGLCADDTRSVKQYHILSDDGSELILKANIDNWST